MSRRARPFQSLSVPLPPLCARVCPQRIARSSRWARRRMWRTWCGGRTQTQRCHQQCALGTPRELSSSPLQRAYKEHQCKFIFQFEQLELGELASALALLRLPKLKELGKKRKKGKGKDDGWVEWAPIVEVELDSIKFKDKQREKQRQQNKANAAKKAVSYTHLTLPTICSV
eukprot:393512-Prymnesium_polylepis.1